MDYSVNILIIFSKNQEKQLNTISNKITGKLNKLSNNTEVIFSGKEKTKIKC